MARQQRTEREMYWQDLIDRQGANSQSIADFCKGEGISTASFYAWRRRLHSPGRPVPSQAPRSALVPVRIVPEPSLAREAVIGVKVLYFVGDGLVIFYRYLERGTFELPRGLISSAGDAPLSVEIRQPDLALILEGIELSSVRRRKRWRREP